MRTLVLATIGLGVLLGAALPSRTLRAQSSGQIARLSSAAYAPDSPVRENKLFQYQTGHYGFTYNCDGEEDKRNHPAIRWRKASQCQLHQRMGCMERIRHEVAQVSRRILDGVCDSVCESCQQQRRQSDAPSCGCPTCLANKDSDAIVDVDSLANANAEQTMPSPGLLVANQSENEQAAESAKADPISTKRRGSGLVSRTPLESATPVELDAGEVLVGSAQVVPATIEAVQLPVESIQLPVARITSVTVGSGLESVIEAVDKTTNNDVAEVSPPAPAENTHRMGLLERLKQVQSAQASDLSKPANF